MVGWSVVFSIFLVACASLGKAFVVAAGGIAIIKAFVVFREISSFVPQAYIFRALVSSHRM